LSKFFQRFGAILLIMVTTFVVYAPALRNGFVWDDTALVLRDPLIRSWRLIDEGFRHFLFVDATGSNFYRPLQRLTFTFDYAAWGFGHPGGWHFTSITTHAAAAVALYAFLCRGAQAAGLSFAAARREPTTNLGVSREDDVSSADRSGEPPERTGQRPVLPFSLAPLLVALIWAIHPLHTSAVTYVSGRADSLAALCGFAGLWFALGTNRRAQLYAALCFLGALLSKESGSVFLLIWLALVVWKRVPPRALIYAVLVLALYLPLRFTAQKTPPPPSETTPLIARPILAARAVAEYVGLIVAPVNLRMERDVATRPAATSDLSKKNARQREWQTLLGAVLIAGMVVWFCRAETNTRFALLAAALAYLPISNITPLNATVAEHWLYVPSAFLFAAVALVSANIATGPMRQRTALALVALWATFLAARTWIRQADWRDQRTFLTRTIAAGGDSARMHVNLGNLEAAEGHTDRALAEYAEALRRSPDLSFAHFAIAATQLKLGHFAEAHAALARVAAAPGLDAEKLQLRAALDFAEKKIDPAPGYRAAADLAPLNWPLRRRYFTALAQSGRKREAVDELRAFLAEQDFRADPWLLLADLFPLAADAARAEARQRDVRLP